MVQQKVAYKFLKHKVGLKIHPDKLRGNNKAEANFKKIGAAFDQLEKLPNNYSLNKKQLARYISNNAVEVIKRRDIKDLPDWYIEHLQHRARPQPRPQPQPQPQPRPQQAPTDDEVASGILVQRMNYLLNVYHSQPWYKPEEDIFIFFFFGRVYTGPARFLNRHKFGDVTRQLILSGILVSKPCLVPNYSNARVVNREYIITHQLQFDAQKDSVVDDQGRVLFLITGVLLMNFETFIMNRTAKERQKKRRDDAKAKEKAEKAKAKANAQAKAKAEKAKAKANAQAKAKAEKAKANAQAKAKANAEKAKAKANAQAKAKAKANEQAKAKTPTPTPPKSSNKANNNNNNNPPGICKCRCKKGLTKGRGESYYFMRDGKKVYCGKTLGVMTNHCKKHC